MAAQHSLKKIRWKDSIMIFPVLFLLFETFFLDKIIEKSSRNIYNFRCARTNDEFNISLVNENGTVRVYDKFKEIYKFDYEDLENALANSVKSQLLNAFSTKKAFHIRLSGANLIIYTERSVGDEVYTLENEKVSTFEELLNTKIVPWKPVSLKMLKTFIYLLCTGYFENRILLLYKRSLLIYTFDGRFKQFDVDLKPLMDTDLSGGRNRLLCLFRVFKSQLVVMSDLIPLKYYSLEIFENRFLEFLHCDKDKEIMNLIQEERYLETESLVKDEDIEKIIQAGTEKEAVKEFKKFVILED